MKHYLKYNYIYSNTSLSIICLIHSEHIYYQHKELFENFGFQAYYNQHVYCKDLNEPYPEKFYERANRINSRKNISFEHMKSYDFKKSWFSIVSQPWLEVRLSILSGTKVT